MKVTVRVSKATVYPVILYEGENLRFAVKEEQTEGIIEDGSDEMSILAWQEVSNRRLEKNKQMGVP
jgi:hypothetical protein